MSAKGHTVQKDDEMTVEWWPTERVIPYARNPRVAPEAAVAKVAGSIKEFGWKQPIVVDAEGVIIAGHTRLAAAQRLGLERVPVLVATDLTPAQVKAYRLADNRTAQETTWDHELLELEIEDLSGLDFDLALTGFDGVELEELIADDDGDGKGGGGSLLELVDVAIDEPRHVVEEGQVWRVGRHVLLCVDVMRGWQAWSPYLEEGSLFVPYPGPYVALTEPAENGDARLVMVQPDPYIAGHLLDQYAAVHGEDSVGLA